MDQDPGLQAPLPDAAYDTLPQARLSRCAIIEQRIILQQTLFQQAARRAKPDMARALQRLNGRTRAAFQTDRKPFTAALSRRMEPTFFAAWDGIAREGNLGLMRKRLDGADGENGPIAGLTEDIGALTACKKEARDGR